ncbi:MAG: DUF1186 domain-containing protein [Saprospiraceae bacterium]|nr:DUF1186 domain-containing protein [Saprospiraceae bacterium]
METRKDITTKLLKSLGLRTIFHNEKWLDYRNEGIEQKDLDFIKEFIADKNYIIDYGIEGDYSAIHAWRILGQMKEISSIPFLIKLLFVPDNIEADIYWLEFPKIMGLMGAVALSHLIPLLLETNTYKESDYNLDLKSSVVVAALAEIVKGDAAKRKEVIQTVKTYVTEVLCERDNFFISCALSSLSIIDPVELKELMLHLLNVNRIDHEGINNDEIDKYLT